MKRVKKQLIFYFQKSEKVGNSGRWFDLDMGSYFDILKIAEIIGKCFLYDLLFEMKCYFMKIFLEMKVVPSLAVLFTIAYWVAAIACYYNYLDNIIM